jgi:hypothetical protein
MHRKIEEALITLNLFENSSNYQDPIETKITRRMTRIYLIVLALALILITTYTAINFRLEIQTVDYPSEKEFIRLQSLYPSTLICPCSASVIPYQSFVSLSPLYHPLCSSFFVSDEWVKVLTDVKDSKNFLGDDFRYSAPMIFNTYSTLCQLANITLFNAWEVLGRSFIISDAAWSESSLQARVDVIIQQFQRRTVSDFTRGILILQSQIQHTLIPDNGNVE